MNGEGWRRLGAFSRAKACYLTPAKATELVGIIMRQAKPPVLARRRGWAEFMVISEGTIPSA